jgi:lysozyme family protein
VADFRTAVLITIDPEHEGGYQNNPHDHANWSSGKIGEGQLIGTKYGITAVDLPGVVIKDLTPDQAIAYYEQHYWKSLYSQIESQIVANKLFDLGVLFGVGTAIKVMQATLAPTFSDVTIDGGFGPKTLDAVNQSEETSLLKAYISAFVAHAIHVVTAKPEEKPFFADWVKRINS